MSSTPSQALDLYKQYVQAWSAIPNAKRQSILKAVLAPDVLYRIPRMEGIGHQVVLDDMNDFQSKFPDGRFDLHSVSMHHDVALMEWQLILPDGTPGVLGHDAIRLTSEGKLGQITTFAPSTREPRPS